MEYFKDGTVCGIENCPSKEFRWESGMKVCKRGHEHEGVQRQQDEDDFGKEGRKTRRKKEVEEKAVPAHRGSRALELYFQAYQLILWKQCFALVHDKGFPSEFEGVVRDLWALRLQLLKDRLGDVSEESGTSKMFRSQVEVLESGSEEGLGKKGGSPKENIPRLVGTLGLCYLGGILLRLPISLGDIYRWAVREEIPFFRAIRHIPRTLRSKLLPQYVGALDTQVLIQPETLHKAVYRLVILFDHSFSMTLPALNYPPLLFKFIRELALPLELYITVQRLSSLLSRSHTFPTPNPRQTFHTLPEIQLLSLLIIATKLHHPHDSIPRCTSTLTEPGTLALDWDAWCQAQATHAEKSSTTKSARRAKTIATSEKDVFAMSNAQLDDYLDWYEETWVDQSGEPNPKGLPQQLLDMFPMQRRQSNNIETSTPLPPGSDAETTHGESLTIDKLVAVQQSMKLRDLVSEPSEGGLGLEVPVVRRIGSFYKHYRREEDLSSEPARAFHEAAAELVGVSLTTLLQCVFRNERELRLWKDRKDRNGVARGAEADGDASDV